MKRRKFAWWAPLLLLIPLLLPAGDLPSVTRILRHRDVRSILSRVSDEMGPEGSVSIDRKSNSLRVTDESGRLKAIVKLIDLLDQPAHHFALSAKLDVMPRPVGKSLFKDSVSFVDATSWAAKNKPAVSYECVTDLYEGGNASCNLGPYTLSTSGGGYDPSERRISLSSMVLSHRAADGSVSKVIEGAAVLKEGTSTLFLVGGSVQEPPLRLGIKPTLLPRIVQPEKR